jgi:hypothetical protein
LQASADFRELGGFFENVNSLPAARQAQRRRHTTDSSSENQKGNLAPGYHDLFYL